MTASEYHRLLGVANGRYVVADDDGRVLGRWESYGDAEAHRGEHQAMDPEAQLSIYDVEDNC